MGHRCSSFTRIKTRLFDSDSWCDWVSACSDIRRCLLLEQDFYFVNRSKNLATGAHCKHFSKRRWFFGPQNEFLWIWRVRWTKRILITVESSKSFPLSSIQFKKQIHRKETNKTSIVLELFFKLVNRTRAMVYLYSAA